MDSDLYLESSILSKKQIDVVWFKQFCTLTSITYSAFSLTRVFWGESTVFRSLACCVSSWTYVPLKIPGDCVFSLFKQLQPSSSSNLRNDMPSMACVFADGFWGRNTEVPGHEWMTMSLTSTGHVEEGVWLISAYSKSVEQTEKAHSVDRSRGTSSDHFIK